VLLGIPEWKRIKPAIDKMAPMQYVEPSVLAELTGAPHYPKWYLERKKA
jgi:hypothetical protein